ERAARHEAGSFPRGFAGRILWSKHAVVREVVIRVIQMSAPEFDLQAHSTRSDGALEPAAVVAAAAAAGVRLLALTDHDTVDGVDEALQAGAAHGLDVVSAIELSALDDDREDLHLLGYRLDHRSARLLEALAELRAD